MFDSYKRINVLEAFVNFGSAFTLKAYPSYEGSLKKDKENLYKDYKSLSGDLDKAISKIKK